MFRALLFSSVGHVVVFSAFAFELDIPLFAIQDADPIEIEIVFEEEKIDVTEDLVIEDFEAVAALNETETETETPTVEELPVLEAPQDAALDPLFLPESKDDPSLPDGLEDFVETAEVTAGTDGDLSKDFDALDPEARGPANDQSPAPNDAAEPNADAIEDLIAKLEEKSSQRTDEGEDTPEPTAVAAEAEAETSELNLPPIPKPRPRAAPVYRDLLAEQKAAEAQLAAAEAAEAAEQQAQAAEEQAAVEEQAKAEAEAAEQAASSAAAREAEARKSAAEQRSKDHVQVCVNAAWIYSPAFITDRRKWQVSFVLSLDAEGKILDYKLGDVGAEPGATEDNINAFVASAEDALYGCEAPFVNPSGASGESFELPVTLNPGKAY